MEKYLGNKASLLPLIERFFIERIPGASRLSDVFAGTNNVSRYFRARGWSTAACDANRFSYVLAQAYLGTSAPPQFQAVRSIRTDPFRMRNMQNELARSIGRYGALYLPGRAAEQVFQELAHLANVLVRLQGIGEKNQQAGVITEYFTQWGGRSSYTSLRGTQGLRNTSHTRTHCSLMAS